MKKTNLLLVVLSTLCMSSCDKAKPEVISFKQYVEIVNEAKEEDKNIFIFTASGCSHCQIIRSSLERYVDEELINNDINMYELSVDYKTKLDGTIKFKDKTLGYLSGDSTNDSLKQLDKRLASFALANKDYVFKTYPSSKYMYVGTPLILWYEGKEEVKIINNVSEIVKYDENNQVIYESFKELMQYPETNLICPKEFDLTYQQ